LQGKYSNEESFARQRTQSKRKGRKHFRPSPATSASEASDSLIFFPQFGHEDETGSVIYRTTPGQVHACPKVILSFTEFL
jgi:hypothetical protein